MCSPHGSGEAAACACRKPRIACVLASNDMAPPGVPASSARKAPVGQPQRHAAPKVARSAARGGDRGRRPTAAAGARASSIYALKRAVATSAGREFRSLLARWEQAAKGPVEVAASGAGPLPEERRRQPLLLQPAGVDWGVGNMGDSSAKGCRNVEVYEKVEQVGEGTYG